MTTPREDTRPTRPGRIPVRDTELYVDVTGHGYPLLLMHGGPGADHWTLQPFRQLADRFTLIFYDHRCNGRSGDAPVSSMTFENLTADADALRQSLGYDRWAVLGHSFGGHVALEYALRYPGSVSHLILADTGGDSVWSRRNAAELLAARGYSAAKAELVRRWFNGEFPPRQMPLILMRIGSAYYSHPSLPLVARELASGGWRTKMRPEAMIFAGRHLLDGWSVMDKLGQITAPTLILAGQDDFIFPPEHQRELAAAIPKARLQLIENAGHNPHVEQPAVVMQAITNFLSADGAGPDQADRAPRAAPGGGPAPPGRSVRHPGS